MCEFKGSDPVMLKVKDVDVETRVLSASMFWVDTSNELVNKVTQAFKDRLEINIRSMDSKEESFEKAAV